MYRYGLGYSYFWAIWGSRQVCTTLVEDLAWISRKNLSQNSDLSLGFLQFDCSKTRLKSEFRLKFFREIQAWF